MKKIKKFLLSNKKFIIVFIATFIGFHLLEELISYYFGISMDNLNLGWLGWLGFIIMYGFKLHIFCCLLPLLFTTYKCRHKGCDHEQCKK